MEKQANTAAEMWPALSNGVRLLDPAIRIDNPTDGCLLEFL